MINHYNSTNSVIKNIPLNKIPIQNPKKNTNNNISLNIQKNNIEISKSNSNNSVNNFVKTSLNTIGNFNNSAILNVNKKVIAKNSEIKKLLNHINYINNISNNNSLHQTNIQDQKEISTDIKENSKVSINKNENKEKSKTHKTRNERNDKIYIDNDNFKNSTSPQNRINLSANNNKGYIIKSLCNKKDIFFESKKKHSNVNNNKISNIYPSNKKTYNKQILLNFNKALKDRDFVNNLNNINNTSTNNINNSSNNNGNNFNKASSNNNNKYVNLNPNIINTIYSNVNIARINLDRKTENDYSKDKLERTSSEKKILLKTGSFLSYIPTVKTDLYNPEKEKYNKNSLDNKRNFICVNSPNNLREARKRKYSVNTDDSNDSNFSISYNNSNNNINFSDNKLEKIYKKLEYIEISKEKYKLNISNNDLRTTSPLSNFNTFDKNTNFPSEKNFNLDLLSPLTEKNRIFPQVSENDYYDCLENIPNNETNLILDINYRNIDNVNLKNKEQNRYLFYFNFN